jgi:hypothetical protein
MAATMTAAKNQWTDYAVLQPSVPRFDKHGDPVRWKVQINQHGQFRCGCPSYIFSKAPKGCKHTRVCDEQKSGTVLMPVQAAKPTPQHPQWASAVSITKEMIVGANVAVSTQQMHAMCEVLAAKLAAFTPARVPIKPTSHTDLGVRYITFNDD